MSSSLTVISKISEEIIAEAQAEAQKRIEEAKKEAEEIVNKAKAEAENEAEKIKVRVVEEARFIEARKLSEARRQFSLKILEEKNKLIEEAFNEALNRLKKIVETELYTQSLSKLIETIAPQLGETNLKISLNHRDLKHKDAILRMLNLPANIKITFDNHPINSIGGFILSTLDGRIRINETLEERAKAVKTAMRRDIAKLLFGE
ncbi:MAG: V-type ATP synthase subunit E [Candidatus Bathyarchaeota archaeon]